MNPGKMSSYIAILKGILSNNAF